MWAQAEGYAVQDAGFPWGVALLALALGGVVGAGAMIMQRSRAIKSGKSSNYHRDTIAYKVYGYYIWQRKNGQEVCSQKLREILGIKTADNRFMAIGDMLAPEGLAVLQQRIILLKTDGEEFTTMLRTKAGRIVECIGLYRDGTHPDGAGITLWFRDITDREKNIANLKIDNRILVQTRDRLLDIMEVAPFPIWQRGASLNVNFCNRVFAGIVDVISGEVDESRKIELDTQARQLAQTAFESGKPQEADIHIVVKGTRKLFHVTEIPLTNPDGSRNLVGFAYDVSLREKVEAELKRHSAAQGELLDSSVNAKAIFGPDMRLRYYNNSFVRLWKLEESWLMTEPTYGDVLEALREKRRLPEQANFPAFKKQQLALFTELLETREDMYYLPDGSVLRIIIIPHAEGGLLFSYEDVTDRLVLERNYNTLIAVQRATLDRLYEALAVFAENGCLKICNPEFRSMWDISEELVATEPHILKVMEHGKKFYASKLPDSEWELVKRKGIGIMNSRQMRSGRLERDDGRVLDWSCVPLPDGATLVTYYDVTDSTLVERSLRERAAALEEADRLKTEFLASVSYELRSPLTAVLGFSEVLSNDYFGTLNDKQREYVRDIYVSSLQLTNLINDILDLATIEAGYMQLDIRRFGIYDMLLAAKALIQERARESQLELRLECDPAIGEMEADEQRIKQMMFNLLSNAVKFTEAGGSVVLGANTIGEDGIALWVEDTGIGITPEEQGHIFKRFYKAGSDRIRKPGTGMGLSMVERFTHLLEGKVELVSELGKGTRVTLYFSRNNPELAASYSEHLFVAASASKQDSNATDKIS